MGEAVAYLTRGESMRLSFFCAFNLARNNAFFLACASIVDYSKVLGAFLVVKFLIPLNRVQVGINLSNKQRRRRRKKRRIFERKIVVTTRSCQPGC